MAAAVSGVTVVFDGAVRIRYATITMDNSYATGGEAVSADQFGLYSLDAVFPAGGSGVNLAVDSTGLKILSYGTNTTTQTTTTLATVGLTQIPSATDLSTVAFKVLVVGH